MSSLINYYKANSLDPIAQAKKQSSADTPEALHGRPPPTYNNQSIPHGHHYLAFL